MTILNHDQTGGGGEVTSMTHLSHLSHLSNNPYTPLGSCRALPLSHLAPYPGRVSVRLQPVQSPHSAVARLITEILTHHN